MDILFPSGQKYDRLAALGHNGLRQYRGLSSRRPRFFQTTVLSSIFVELEVWHGRISGFSWGFPANSSRDSRIGLQKHSRQAGSCLSQGTALSEVEWEQRSQGQKEKQTGWVGVNGSLSVLQCPSIGVVSGGEYVGGLVGLNGVVVRPCYSNSTVSGTDNVGGLVGRNEFHGDLTDCYSAGEVNGVSSSGGLVGVNICRITRCYSTALVNGDELVGGLVGSGSGFFGGMPAFGTATDCFWDTQTSDLSWSDGGTSLTTSQMQTTGAFLDAGWDFVGETANGTGDIWWINEGQDYPRLWWELIPEN